MLRLTPRLRHVRSKQAIPVLSAVLPTIPEAAALRLPPWSRRTILPMNPPLKLPRQTPPRLESGEACAVRLAIDATVPGDHPGLGFQAHTKPSCHFRLDMKHQRFQFSESAVILIGNNQRMFC